LTDQQVIEEARENVRVELESFILLMEKLELVRVAEMRQAEEYELTRRKLRKFVIFTYASMLIGHQFGNMMKHEMRLSG
jgi:hypothetical protein